MNPAGLAYISCNDIFLVNSNNEITNNNNNNEVFCFVPGIIPVLYLLLVTLLVR